MKTDYDESILDYRKLPNGNYIKEMKKDNGLDDDCDFKKLHQPIYASILGNSKQNMKNFIIK